MTPPGGDVSNSLGVTCLAVTGFPGWLTQALLDDLTACDSGLREVKAFVHPSVLPVSAELRTLNPILSSVHALDLGRMEHSPEVDAALRGVDVLIHSAAVIHVHRTADWYRINTRGTIRLAQAARAAGVRRFVFISSNAAGGRCESDTQVLTESDPARPLSHYGRSKLLAEQALMEMHQQGVFEIVVLRPSMFYGPPVPDRHIDVYRRIVAGSMPMVGDGHYRRSITYIGNLVQATRLAMSHPAAAGEIFYVVDEPVYTTRSITEAMAAALGVPLKILPLPAIVGPIAYRADRALAAAGLYWKNLHLVGEAHWHVALSCGKIERSLGYVPAVTIGEGMRRAVEWCRREGKL
jgi:nucleoside-diphosphate-sugar epimerase